MQGLPGSLPEAAATARRRKLLGRSEDPGYTAGSGFDMGALQRKDDVISQCTQSVLCDESVRDIDNAVVDIYAINLQLGAMAVCTGKASQVKEVWLSLDVPVITRQIARYLMHSELLFKCGLARHAMGVHHIF